jgi:hypothetical protein
MHSPNRVNSKKAKSGLDALIFIDMYELLSKKIIKPSMVT